MVATLLHDVGKAITVHNHAGIAAEILRPYVREDVYRIIRVHQDFQGQHYYEYLGSRADAHEHHRDKLAPEVFDMSSRFADDWDQPRT